MLIDRRRDLGMGEEQVRALLRSHLIAQLTDAPALAAQLHWAISLLEAGDRLGTVAATELAQTVHRNATAGAYLRRAAVVTAADDGPPLDAQLAALTPPGPNDLRDAASLRAWAAPILALHREEASNGFGILASGEWTLAMQALGLRQ